MPNTFSVIQMVSQALLANLINNLKFAAGVDRRWEDDFGKAGHKIGDFLDIRKTPRYAVQDGPTYVGQPYVEETVRLTIDKQKHVDVDFTSVEMTLKMDDWNNRVGKPEAAKLANQVDYDGLALYWQVANSELIADVTTSYIHYLDAAAKLDMEAVPRDDQRSVILHPYQQPPLLNELKGLFQQSTEIGRQYTDGMMGRTAGAKWNVDQNVAVHTTGALATGGTPIVTTADQTGSSLATSGWANSTLVLKQGDVFTLADVYAVNPQNLASTGKLRDFVATADVTSGATGLATIPLFPALIAPPDPRATVHALAAASAPITCLGTANTPYAQNLMYHPMGITMANVKMFVPWGGEASVASDAQVTMALRVWKDSDIREDQHLQRADLLYGWLYTMPECCVRIWSPMT